MLLACPLTKHTLAQIALGLAGNFVVDVLLNADARKIPIVLCPAMTKEKFSNLTSSFQLFSIVLQGYQVCLIKCFH